tara:strand:- start:31242 stop:31493 length:252 start_codon:yes stop_codon:yes gene_type:complete
MASIIYLNKFKSFIMIITNYPQPAFAKELLLFLENELGLSKQAIELGIKHALSENAPLPIVLWSFGLISLEQFEKVIFWQDNN